MHRSVYEGRQCLHTLCLAIKKTAKPFHLDHVTFSFEESIATVAVESLCSLRSDCGDMIDGRLLKEFLYFTFICMACWYRLIDTDNGEDEGRYAAFYFLGAINELFAIIGIPPRRHLWGVITGGYLREAFGVFPFGIPASQTDIKIPCQLIWNF